VSGEAKLTVYLGRRSGPGHREVVDALHAAGVAGATVLLGVDGTAHGVRQRARFFGRNAEVPLMVISVGDGTRIARVLPQLGDVIATIERVDVLKRDGIRYGVPEPVDAPLQKLMVYASEQPHLLRRLRAAGAAGATSLRGMWGYHGDHAPHGDSFWQLRRRAPVVTVIVDAPDRIARWFEIVDELTAESGLVTSEMIPTAPLA
jgi:PII-like signaling protein